MKATAQSKLRASAFPEIREEVVRFQDYLRAEKRSENTVWKYGDTLDGFLEWYGKSPKNLTKADLQAWKGYLATERGYCENTMSTMIAAVNQYLERILERPDMKMRPPRRVFREPIPLTEAEVSRILEEARKPRIGRKGFRNNADLCLRDHAILCILYYGGLRAGEVVNLRLSDLDLDNNKLRVHEGKGKDYSLVNLSEEAVAGIREYLDHGRPQPRPEYADRLILTLRGKPIPRTKLLPIVKRVAFRAGIEKKVYPHIFRHSMITHMAEKGIPAQMIQAQSRHKSLDMVQKYTHLSQQSVRAAYDRAFSKKPQSETIAQKEDESETTVRKDLREMALERYLDDKISEDKLEKILSRLDGARPARKEPQERPFCPSYA